MSCNVKNVMPLDEGREAAGQVWVGLEQAYWTPDYLIRTWPGLLISKNKFSMARFFRDQALFIKNHIVWDTVLVVRLAKESETWLKYVLPH